MNKGKIQGKRIKIYTRSFSLEMYRYASALFQIPGIPVVRLTDQTADGYFYTILKDMECDIAINIDEDAFIVGIDSILELINFVIENNYANAGCPDGGGAAPRSGNPIVTNPFFNILNLELIRTLPINKKVINRFDYNSVKDKMIKEFPVDILYNKYDFNLYDYEPYYPFFFWLAYNFKTLYLPSEKHKDGISTILYNHKQQVICYHSWFARFYKIIPEQTIRITALMDQAYETRGIPKLKFSFIDKCKFLFDLCIRWCIKIPMRMVNWPNKWKKWYRHSMAKRNNKDKEGI